MTIKNKNRAEFSQKTRELTAKRAGYRCSFPGCDCITVGPANNPQESSTFGIAAHIYCAATSGSGPRSTGGLSDEELMSPQNAIWLCANHASLIDKHSGEEYPAERLHSYKNLHETRIAHELTGSLIPFGWVDRLKVNSSPLFAEEIQIEFAKLTLIYGDNGTGKTALCEWLAALTQARYFERWINGRNERKKLSIEVDYHNPEPHTISASFLNKEFPEYKLDDTRTIIPTAPLKIIFPNQIDYRNNVEKNDLDLISKALNLHPLELQALCEELEENDIGYIRRAWFEEDDEGCFMYAEVENDRPITSFQFGGLSDSERERVMMELGILAANKFATINPTILILDSGFWSLDTDWLKRYADLLGSPTCKFQTIASLVSTRVNLNSRP